MACGIVHESRVTTPTPPACVIHARSLGSCAAAMLHRTPRAGSQRHPLSTPGRPSLRRTPPAGRTAVPRGRACRRDPCRALGDHSAAKHEPS